MREVFDVGGWDLDALVKGVVSIVFMRLASAFSMFKLSFESAVDGGLLTADYHWQTVTGRSVSTGNVDCCFVLTFAKAGSQACCIRRNYDLSTLN